MEKSVILAAVRDDMDMPAVLKQISYLKHKFQADIRTLKTDNILISSTAIRNSIKNNIPIGNMLPPKVEKYIKDNGLYV